MKNSRLAILVLAVSLAVAPVRADELQSLPSATAPSFDEPPPDAPETSDAVPETRATEAEIAVAPAIARINLTVPTYIENGVIMVPLRPLAQFLRLKVRTVLGVTILERKSDSIRLMFRNNSTKAQSELNGFSRLVTLPAAPQTRLGNGFVPARAVSNVFGAILEMTRDRKVVLLTFQGRTGLLSSASFNDYHGSDAATVVIENNVGKALSLRLSGPEIVRIELGARGRITRQVRPGVYTFQAASSGMKPRIGTRRFFAKQRAVWNWGRK